MRQFFFEANPVLVTDLHGETESFRTFLAPINFQTQAGDHYEANYAPEYQRLTEPFEIAPGVVIPIGSYQFHRFRVQTRVLRRAALLGRRHGLVRRLLRRAL